MLADLGERFQTGDAVGVGAAEEDAQRLGGRCRGVGMRSAPGEIEAAAEEAAEIVHQWRAASALEQYTIGKIEEEGRLEKAPTVDVDRVI
jgi:hypothetical protein